jgi:hypothetical protein
MGAGIEDNGSEGFSLQPAVYTAIDNLVPLGGTILELGSGLGDAKLIEKYNVYAVEHDSVWLDKVPGVNYIHAPLTPIKPTRWHPQHGGWYDPSTLKRIVPQLKYDLLIVDGPPGDVGRGGYLKYWDIFDPSVPVIMDDVHRYEEWKMLRVLSDKMKKNIILPPTGTERLFAVFGTPEQLKELL